MTERMMMTQGQQKRFRINRLLVKSSQANRLAVTLRLLGHGKDAAVAADRARKLADKAFWLSR